MRENGRVQMIPARIGRNLTDPLSPSKRVAGSEVALRLRDPLSHEFAPSTPRHPLNLLAVWVPHSSGGHLFSPSRASTLPFSSVSKASQSCCSKASDLGVRFQCPKPCRESTWK